MKKLFKVIIINIIAVIFILFTFEFLCAYISFNANTGKISIKEKIFRTIKYSKIHYTSPQKMDYKELVRPFNANYIDSIYPIILMGCSFTYGDGLKEEEAFHSILAEQTKCNVINAGLCCASPREALYILRDKETQKELYLDSNRAKYVIYTYISAHKKRLYTDCCQFRRTPFFKHNSSYSELTYVKNSDIHLSFAYNFITAFVYEKYLKPNQYDKKLLFLYLKEINKEVRNKYKDENGNPSQFIVLVYEDNDNEDWDLLKSEGIKIIDLNEMTKTNLKDRQYKLENYHPNTKAWRIIVPELIKKLP